MENLNLVNGNSVQCLKMTFLAFLSHHLTSQLLPSTYHIYSLLYLVGQSLIINVSALLCRLTTVPFSSG